jgi:hypothetical protein
MERGGDIDSKMIRTANSGAPCKSQTFEADTYFMTYSKIFMKDFE